MVNIILVGIFSIALAFLPTSILATEYPRDNNVVSIQLSNTCITMLSNNITTTCPTYWELMYLGLDTSLPGTGEFYYDDNEFYKRGASPYKKDVHELYIYDDYHILVDPPNEIASRSKLIIISPTLPVFVPLGGYEKVNNERTLQKDRYVKECLTATITSENWQLLIADTINYMRTGCGQTVYADQFVERDYISSMDRTTSQKFKYDTWLEEAKKKCKIKC